MRQDLDQHLGLLGTWLQGDTANSLGYLALQGLLAATCAAIRAAQKRAQMERPRLQSRARRDKLQAALADAQTAAAAAQRLMQGGRH